MAQITFTIPDENVTEVNNALASTANWPATAGETKAQASRRAIIEFIKEQVRVYRLNEAVKTAAAEADLLNPPDIS